MSDLPMREVELVLKRACVYCGEAEGTHWFGPDRICVPCFLAELEALKRLG